MFGKRLRDLREDNDLSQKKLAEILSVSTSAVGMWERDQRVPDKDTLIKLADFFGVSIDYLFGRNTYIHNLNNNTYTLKFDKNLKKKLTKEELDDFINYLIDIGFDVEKALEKANKNK